MPQPVPLLGTLVCGLDVTAPYVMIAMLLLLLVPQGEVETSPQSSQA